jgi:hypothetical protein
MHYGGQIIGQPLQMQQARANAAMPLHPTAAASRGLLQQQQQQQHGLGPGLGAGGLAGSPLTNGLQARARGVPGGSLCCACMGSSARAPAG